jgi:hypothetical protein
VTESAARVEVARVGPEHLAALAGFYAAVWDPSATAESVRVAREQAGTPPTWIVLREGRAIGHVTTIPLTLWANGQEQPAYWIKGLWVLPEFQRSAVGFLVLRTAIQQLGSVASMALAHDPAALRLFGAVGFKDLGGLPNDLRVLHSRRVLSRLDPAALPLGRWSNSAALRIGVRTAALAGPLGDAAMALWSALAAGTSGYEVDVVETFDRAGVDQLWQSARGEVPAAPRRAAAELAARYGTSDYVFVRARIGDRLAGLAIVKRPREDGDPRLRGIRVATLSDVLYRPSESGAGLALLRGAERAARKAGADALLSGASIGALRPLLRRRAFVPVPSNLHVLARIPGEHPAALGAWWVTRGDSGGDGSF